MAAAPDPAEYFDDVLYHAVPGGGRVEIGPAARWQAWWRTQAQAVAAEYPGLAAVALGQGFALTSAQLREQGIPRHSARRSVRDGTWSAPRRGVVSIVDPARDPDADRWTLARRVHALSAAAAAVLNPGHVVSGRSAAVLHGLPTFAIPDTAELSAEPHRSTHGTGFREAALAPADVSGWWGVGVTSAARTVLDLARHDRRDGLMAADAALHERLTHPGELDDAVERMHHWPGTPQAREILRLASPAAESALESLVRLALHDDGFPPPHLQVEIAVPGRRVPYRVDMLWPQRRLILEIDGRGKYDAAALRRERRREAELRAVGYRIERVLWADVVDEWPVTGRLLRAALAA